MPWNVKSLVDRVRSSLFFVPMGFVLLGVVLGEAMLLLDARVEGVPDRLTATVDSARNVLTVVAGATLAFAGIAFSVSLLLISLASSQYSPRVVHGMFRDPFNKRVMGSVIGTFTYCLVVMRAVRGPLEQSGEPIIPSLSTLLAVVLGVVSILSIVGFINHGAHSMDVSRILHRVTEEALTNSRQAWGEEGLVEEDVDLRAPSQQGEVVSFTGHGWVQQIDHERLLSLLESHSTMELQTAPGKYALDGGPVARIWPAPEDADAMADKVRSAVALGETRTLQQDVSYGVRQLADVALKAMSPGINDPTTAHDALAHLGSVVSELLRRVPPPRRLDGAEGRCLLVPGGTTHADLVGLAFDEVRIASAGQPTVLVYILEVLHLVLESLGDLDRPGARAALRIQANLTLAMNQQSELPAADLDRVRTSHAQWFGVPETV